MEISGYEIHEKFFDTDQIVVYHAKRLKDQQPVLLKTLRADLPALQLIDELRHEYEITRSLNVPGILETYEFINGPSVYALALEEIQGQLLHKYLHNQELDLAAFFKIALQIVGVLAQVHKKQVVHKDINPDNILIESKTNTIKLVNFSHATELAQEIQTLVNPSILVGSLPYISPEQTGRMNHSIDYRCDFYSLGVTFYEMLTGKLPFTAHDPMEYVHCHLAKIAPPVSSINPKVPEMLSRIVEKLMEKEPSQRYQNIFSLLEDLKNCSDQFEKTGKIEFFELDQEVASDRLNISQKLYGRDEQVQSLLASYDRVQKGAVEWVLVYGYSGIGKTNLIQSVQKPMTSKRGYYITGKFDQLLRATPYSALVTAFQDYVRQVLAEDPEKLAQIKADIQEGLGEMAQVIIDLFPDLELILGKQNPVEELPPQQAQERLMTYFRRFIQSIAKEDKPLVIFIDDLQWADSGSLRLFELLLTAEDIHYVMLIGAYRDNETDENHPLIKSIKNMDQQQVPLVKIELPPLKLEDYQQLLMDTFNKNLEEVSLLASLLYEKTGGNPFFFKQFLTELYANHAIFFSQETQSWNWNNEVIKNFRIAETVVDLMVNKIERLPEKTIEELRLGACIGANFDLKTLAIVTGNSYEELIQNLMPALQENLLMVISKDYSKVDGQIRRNQHYRFVHDRIQQAAYSLLNEAAKKQIHLRVGRHLLRSEENPQNSAKLFEILDHFNAASDLITEETEKFEIASLNKQAALRAISGTVYTAALRYLKAGIELSDERWWDEHYALMYDLYLQSLGSFHQLSQMEEAQKTIAILLKNSKTPLDKAKVYQIIILQKQTEMQYEDAIQNAFLALDILGVKLPRKQKLYHSLKETLRLISIVRFRKIEDFYKILKPITTPSWQTAIEILDSMFFHGYSTGNANLSHLASLKAMQLTLKHGIYRDSPRVCDNCACALTELSTYFRRLKQMAFKFLDLGENIRATFKNMSEVYVTYCHVVNHWRERLSKIYPFFEKSFQYAVDHGLRFDATLIIYTRRCSILAQGFSMTELLSIFKSDIKFLRGAKGGNFLTLLQLDVLIIQACKDGSLINETELFDLYRKIESSDAYEFFAASSSIGFYYIFFKNSYKETLSYYQKSYELLDIAPFDVYTHDIIAYYFISITKSLAELGPEKSEYEHRAKTLIKHLKNAAFTNSKNYAHQYKLALAVKNDFENQEIRVAAYYDEAIESAKSNGFKQWVAFANELAAEFYIRANKPKTAMAYALEAHFYYSQWECFPKVHYLENLYPQWFSSSTFQKNATITAKTTTAFDTSQLDTLSIIKSSRAISSEIRLNKLFEKMLHIMIENAGADRAVYVEERNDQWQVAAEIRQKNEKEDVVILSIPLSDYEDIPKRVVNYTMRSKKPAIIQDLESDKTFSEDPYFKKTRPHAIMCIPILHYNKVSGILYLENNFVKGTFTDARVALLEMLCSQVSISLENAHHFEDMEILYRSTERFVPKQFLEMLQRKTIQDIKLGDCLRLDISVLFADIRKFTTILEKLNPEDAFAFVNRYWAITAPVIRNNHGFINQYQGDGILALFPESADDAVAAGMNMLSVLKDFNEEQKKLNAPELEIGVGINSGSAMIGIIGEQERLEPAIVSDIANTASRVETLNKTYGTHFLISGNSFNALRYPEKYAIRTVDKVRPKGKSITTYLHEIIDWESQLHNMRLDEYLLLFSEGFANYEKGDFSGAQKKFMDCLQHRPQDQVAVTLKARCEEFIQQGLPEGWDGVYTLTHK